MTFLVLEILLKKNIFFSPKQIVFFGGGQKVTRFFHKKSLNMLKNLKVSFLSPCRARHASRQGRDNGLGKKKARCRLKIFSIFTEQRKICYLQLARQRDENEGKIFARQGRHKKKTKPYSRLPSKSVDLLQTTFTAKSPPKD